MKNRAKPDDDLTLNILLKSYKSFRTTITTNKFI